MTEYITVFDISNRVYTGWLLGLCPLVGAVIGVWAAFWLDTRVQRIAAGVVALLMMLLSVFLVGISLREYVQMRSDFDAGRYAVAEGLVEDFHPDPRFGKGPQTFSVAGQEFELWAATFSADFHHTVGQGGPDLRGRCVRILFTSAPGTGHKQIVWLGIRRSGCPVSSDHV